MAKKKTGRAAKSARKPSRKTSRKKLGGKITKKAAGKTAKKKGGKPHGIMKCYTRDLACGDPCPQCANGNCVEDGMHRARAGIRHRCAEGHTWT